MPQVIEMLAWEGDLLEFLRAGYNVGEAWKLTTPRHPGQEISIGSAQRAQTRFRKEGILKGVTTYDTLKAPNSLPAPTPTPLKLQGDDRALFADLHFPLVDWAFLSRAVGLCKREGIKSVTLQGDALNFDYYGTHPRVLEEAGLASESDAAHRALDLLDKVFDEIVFIPGNHCYRILKRLNGSTADAATALWLSYLGGQRGSKVKMSVLDHHYLETSLGSWCIAHGAQYSSHPGKVAADIALDEQMNAATAHEHHLAITTDRNGRYAAVANGMMADPAKIHYLNLYKKGGRRRMVQGLTLIKGGAPRIYGGQHAPPALGVW